MSLWYSKKWKFFKFFFSNVYIKIMIENEIYCYINGFLKLNIGKKTSYIIGNKKFFGKICILNLRNKRKSIFARVIIRYYGWKKITNETGKNIIKSTYRWKNRAKFRKCGTKGKSAHFRILGVPSIRVVAKRKWYSLSYTFSLKSVFSFQLM